MIGWIGNIFIILGLWGIGNKNRKAFIFSVIGEILWIIKAVNDGSWDLAAICVVFAAVAIRNWFLWGKDA